MKTNDLTTRIKARYNQLTRAEKKVADVILENPARIIFMSITDLAEACEVGDTSVFRFCKSMKLKGYQDFKLQLSLGMSRGDGLGHPAISEREASFSQRTQTVLDLEVQALEETRSLLKEDIVSRVVDYFVSAKRVYFFGVGSSMLSAHEAMNRFLHISPKFFSLSDTHMQAMVAGLLDADDVVVVFSYSGNTKDSVQIAKLAQQAGAKIIGVSHFLKSPLTAHTDELLLCGSMETPLQGGSARGKISQIFLIDILYSEYYRRTEESSALNNEKTSSAVSGKLY